MVDLEIVSHPGAVLIVPFLNREKVILIRQYRPVVNSMMWELPAGTFYKGEPPLGCAKRELVEETGYRAREWKKLGYIYPTPGYSDEKIFIYEARGLRFAGSDLQEDEMLTAHVFSKKDIAGLFIKGKIPDSKTVCALKMARVI